MLIKLVLLGTLQVTAYQARPQDTKPECRSNHNCQTSIGENVNELGIAASQDLLASGTVHYHDVVYVDGIGYRIIFDTMHPRIHNAMDVFVYSTPEERKVGMKHRKVWLVSQPIKEK